jgi:pre-rRNA-processing protein TSR1
VSGYLRGASLNVNNLIHIPDFGDFQLLQVERPDDPYPLNRNKKPVSMETQVNFLTLVKESQRILGC